MLEQLLFQPEDMILHCLYWFGSVMTLKTCRTCCILLLVRVMTRLLIWCYKSVNLWFCNAASSAQCEPQCELNIKLWSDSISRSGYDVWRKAALRYSKTLWRPPLFPESSCIKLWWAVILKTHMNELQKHTHVMILRQLAKIIHATPSHVS